MVEKKWRRGQESNLHSLAAGGFQDRCNTIMRPLRIWQSVNYIAGSFKRSTEFDMIYRKVINVSPPSHVNPVNHVHLIRRLQRCPPSRSGF